MSVKTQTNTIRRCFMTGKQCIYSDNFGEQPTKTSSSVFIAMPYRANMETCFDWSIKPFLQDKIDDLTDNDIKRADDFSHIGAITCQKICRPIQESALVVVDISVPNANVIYELGLAWGLEKKVLLLADEGSYTKTNEKGETYAKSVVKFLGVGEDKVLKYKSTGELTLVSRKLETYYCSVKDIPVKDIPVEDIKAGGKPDKGVPVIGFAGTAEEEEHQPADKSGDISIPFNRLLDSVVGVAGKRIMNAKEDSNKEVKKAALILNKIAGEENPIGFIKCPGTRKEAEGDLIRFFPEEFSAVSNAVNTAFCCIIDLMGEAPQPYFWLGYCHAQGKNAIPIYRTMHPSVNNANPLLQPRNFFEENDIENDRNLANKKETKQTAASRQNILAFDIRALWYIDYDNLKEKKHLANLLKSVFVELINRDLPRKQRNEFWSHLSAGEGKIYIFTGAIYNGELDREMVGDWDQRTVSELVRYLSAADTSVKPILAESIYAPERAFGKKPENNKRNISEVSLETKKKYFDTVRKVLEDKNCVIVASADVNALTEILLAYAFHSDYINNGPSSDVENTVKECIFSKDHYDDPKYYKDKEFYHESISQAVVAIKPKQEGSQTVAIRRFSRQEIGDETMEEGHRGFKIGKDNIVSAEYLSAEKLERSKDDSFKVLSHILIMPNPFKKDKNSEKHYIVILNGYTGPGTFALAEVLTGGVNKGEESVKEKKSEKMPEKINGSGVNKEKESGKEEQSEKMLEKINEHWKDDFKLIQGIISVEIRKGKNKEKTVSLFDNREVANWEWIAADQNNQSGSDDPKVDRKENPWKVIGGLKNNTP